jgi:uncharacterized protein
MFEKELCFYSAGLKLAATLYAPDSAASSKKVPAIVLCHGLRCNRKIVLPAFAKAFAAEGFAALAFDYRGFGESEGQKWRLIARERVEDVVAATTFAALQPEIDPSRIALFGISYGAANAVSAGAVDPRVRAVIAQGGFGDGDRWLRVGRPLWEYWQFRRRIEGDRARRVTTGKSEYVDSFDIIRPTPAEEAYRTDPATKALSVELPLETADDLLTYKPELEVHRISPRPLLVIGAELDYIVDVQESYRLYEKALEPKRLHILPGLSHTEPYSKGLPEVVRLSTEFLREAMPE